MKPGALFATGAAALTTPTRSRSALGARLDVTEDPRDVYRVWVPRRHRLEVRVAPTANVDVRVWSAGTSSVRSSRRGNLLASGTRAGTGAEMVRVRNAAGGAYFYVEAFLSRRTASASYTLSVATRP